MDLLDSSVIQRILSETNKQEERDRRRNAFNAYQIYRGNLEPYVKRELARTRPKSWQGYVYSDISISSMITDKRAQAYNEEPIRSVDGDRDKTEVLTQIYEEGGAEEQLEFFDTLYNLNRYSLMWVNYLTEQERFQFVTMHPYESVLVRDKDTGELLIVGLNYPSLDLTNDARGFAKTGTNNTSQGDGLSDLIAESQTDGSAESQTWVFWSATQHVQVKVERRMIEVDGNKQLKVDIDYMEIEGNPRMENPLGVIPFVLKSTDTSVDYPVPNPLTRQDIKFNVQQSETLTAKNIHGSGVQVLKYPEKLQGKLDKITHGLMSAIELPQSGDPDDAETDFDYKTSGSQLIPMRDIDFAYIEQVAKQNGLENFEIDQGSTDVMNGVSRAIAGASVQKIISKNQKCYAKLERDMFTIIKAWKQWLGSSEFTEDDDLQIVFPRPKVMVSDRETLENIEKMLSLGLIEEWEKFVKMDPNLSEEEAREKLERIQERKIENASKIMGFNNADKQGSIDEDSEVGSVGSNATTEE